MLQNLHVKNLALIDEAEVEFQPELNILTGETGAGKSIILGSIHLALGGKYSGDMLRKGASFGLVELTFSVDKPELREALQTLDIIPEEGVIVLSRKLMEGRSISRINGETVSMNRLKQVAELLIDIHGQHEHQSLLYKKNHLAILDAFAKEEIEALKQDVAVSYKEYKRMKDELAHAMLDEAERAKEVDFLAFEVSQIQEADLKIGEDVILEETYKHMVNSKKIVESVEEAYGYTGDGEQGSGGDLISRAVRCMQDAAHYDTKAAALSEQLLEIDSLLNDFNRDLSEYRRSLEFSEEEFYEAETRLNELNRLKAKYGHSIEDVIRYCEAQEEKLAKLQNYDHYLAELQKSYEKAEEQLSKVAKKLTRKRKEQALLLEEAITAGLLDLNFLEVNFEIAFEELEEYTANGKDAAEFLISMNPGEPVKPLGEIASGGELSRIMLAIKTVLADKDEIPTLIFDEIDVGISGRTAQKVSEKMKVIGKKHQVICITHLAQIAAMADTHFAIEKKVEEGKTVTRIQELSEKESIQELARILGGAEITETVIQNAVEMKKLAKNIT